MSSLDQRILFWDQSAASFTDHTIKLNDFSNSQTVTFTLDAGDYIYISSWLPFNHKYFKLSTVAVTGRDPYIEVNDLATWSPVADTLDYTTGMTATGVLQFTRDINKTWARVPNNKRDIPVMSTAPTTIYDQYWTRISFPDGSITFTASYIGQCFSNDTDLFGEYPQLRNSGLMTAWEQGKANWNDQHLLAATYIAKTLRQKGLIYSNEQLLDIASLRSASVHKTANIIWSGLGAKNYASEIAATEKAFENALTMDKFQVDKDMDGVKGTVDRVTTTRRMTR